MVAVYGANYTIRRMLSLALSGQQYAPRDNAIAWLRWINRKNSEKRLILLLARTEIELMLYQSTATEWVDIEINVTMESGQLKLKRKFLNCFWLRNKIGKKKSFQSFRGPMKSSPQANWRHKVSFDCHGSRQNGIKFYCQAASAPTRWKIYESSEITLAAANLAAIARCDSDNHSRMRFVLLS